MNNKTIINDKVKLINQTPFLNLEIEPPSGDFLLFTEI